MASADAHRAIEAVWRIESARLIAGLTRIVRDVGLAEDLDQVAQPIEEIMVTDGDLRGGPSLLHLHFDGAEIWTAGVSPAGATFEEGERGASRRMRGGAARSNLQPSEQAGGTPAVHR